MMLNRIGVGAIPALTFLLAASAGAQIKTTNVPYTPPANGTTENDSARHKTTQKSTNRAATKAAAKSSTKSTKTDPPVASVPPAGTSPASDAATGTAKAKFGPGRNIGTDGKLRECDARDPSPAGTVIDGYKKVTVPSPMLPGACQWQAVE